MIEKTFEKSYPLTVSQSTLARLANRMLREYKEVFGGEYGDDIMAKYDAIKRCEEVENYDDEYNSTYTCASLNDRTYDTCKTSSQINIYACFDTDEYGDPTYHVYWYFYSCDVYEKRVGEKKITATDYNKMLARVYAAKGKYRYFCTHRPPAPYCVPSGYVSFETYIAGSEHIGEVTYNEQPPKSDLRNWGLEFDPDYEHTRNIILEEYPQ